MNKEKKNPISWVPTIYFAMGLPFVMLSLVSPIIFKDLGVANDQIALRTSLLILPWSLKPIISVLMEVYGTKKQYIIITELLSAAVFRLIVFSLPLPNFFVTCLVLMGVIAFSGSTHDIVGDGMYMQQLDAFTQSIYSGWRGAFYNPAKVLVNDGLIFLAGWLVNEKGISIVASWQLIISICTIILGLVGLYRLYALPKDEKNTPDGDFSQRNKGLWSIFAVFSQKKYIFYYLFFIFLYRSAEELAMKIVPLSLKDSIEVGGLGLSSEQYGLVYGTAGTAAFIIGSIVAGYFVSIVGLRKALFTLACAFSILFAVYPPFAYFQPTSLIVIGCGIIDEYFGYGFGFVGPTLFMMQQIAPRKYQMTHYAFANSSMNLGVMIPGMFSGYLSKVLRYELFFAIVILCTFPALAITWSVPFTYKDNVKHIDK